MLSGMSASTSPSQSSSPKSDAGIQISDRACAVKPSATLAISAKLKKLKAEGHDIIGFGAGEPDFDTPDSIVESAIAALRAGRTRYEPVAGPLDVREAVAEKLRRDNDIDCSAADVVITLGGKGALTNTMIALLDPGRGQEVILPEPAWVSYRPIVELCGGVIRSVETRASDDFKLTPDDLESAITGNTAAIILNTPSNPIGCVYSEAEIRALVTVLERHPHVAVITDEIYESLVYHGEKHFAIGSIPSMRTRTITVGATSKSHAMTGWRLGWLCAPSEGFAAATARIQGQTVAHVAAFTLPAAVTALREERDEVERRRVIYEERGTLFHSLLLEIPGVKCVSPMGAFYVFPDISVAFGKTTPAGRTITSSMDFADALLEEGGVALVPGDAFGAGGNGHVRMSFVVSTDTIREGCKRLAAFMASLTG